MAALESSAKAGTTGVIVVMSSDLPAAKRIDLGKIHGDVLAPRVVGDGGKGLVAIVPDGAPNGTILRLARVDEPLGAGHVVWGAELPQTKDESDAFVIERGAKAVVLAWDDWDAKAGHGVIKAVTFAPSDVTKTTPASVLSGAQGDAEGPVVVARPGGFWAAWIENAKREPDKKERQETHDNAEAVELGPRFVMVEPLDDAGKPTGAPVSVTSRSGHVTGFDLGIAKGGAALVVWRDDATTPGTAGGTVKVALVRPDGSIEPSAVTDEDISGDPSLLIDDARPASPASPHGWLTLTNEADAARLVALDDEGHAVDDLAVESLIGTGAPLSAHGGQVLVARALGRSLELRVFSCEQGTKGAPAPAPADSAPSPE